MHLEILNKDQNDLLPLLAKFNKEFYMVGGTSIALHIGHRSKWKDYLDLYFILKSHYSKKEISDRAKELFQDLFSPKLFNAQLCYFVGINFSEMPDYMPTFETDERTIKDFLIDIALRN